MSENQWKVCGGSNVFQMTALKLRTQTRLQAGDVVSWQVLVLTCVDMGVPIYERHNVMGVTSLAPRSMGGMSVKQSFQCVSKGKSEISKVSRQTLELLLFSNDFRDLNLPTLETAMMLKCGFVSKPYYYHVLSMLVGFSHP